MNHIKINEKLKTPTFIQILIERDDGKKKQKMEI
jgi:hypothetical protein